MSQLCFNILGFNHPQKNINFYFGNLQLSGLQEVHHTIVPQEVIEHFGFQPFYYTSFEKPQTNALCVNKLTQLERANTQEYKSKINKLPNQTAFSLALLKRYYNALIHQYFTQKGFLVKPNFVRDTEVWLPVSNNAKQKTYWEFERYSLRIQFKVASAGPELLLSYEGKSKLFSTPIANLFETIPLKAFNWVVYQKNLYKLADLPEEAKRQYDKVYAVWNFTIRDILQEATAAPDKTNKYWKYKNAIDRFYTMHLNNSTFKQIIPINEEGFLRVTPSSIGMVEKASNQLVFGNRALHQVPYIGITQHGPFELSPTTQVHFFFILHADDKEVAVTIHRYFNGNLPGFKGLTHFIHTPYHPDKGLAIYFNDRENPWPELYAQLNNKHFDSEIQYLAIYLTPISKTASEKSQRLVYYQLKELLLKKGIASQVIDPEKVVANQQYHYSLPNIAIAILAKLSGTPWRLDTKLRNELVVGVGAFKHTEIETKYIGSAFSFANTGKFNRFECFQKNQTKELAGSILRAVKEYVAINKHIRRLVIHFYKEMSREEAEPIERGLKKLLLDIPIFIVTINKTESADVLAFDMEWNDLMPISGTFIQIGNHKYLLFNNTRYTTTNFNKNDGFSFPVKLSISCSNKELLADYKTIKELIDQVYQFSRMYWKSVKQQNLPVTIKYPAMVAEMLPYFNGNEIPDFGKENLWFL